MSRLWVPFTDLHPDTREAVSEANFVDVSHSDYAYFELFRDLWSHKETFIIVEHDIVPVQSQIQSLEDCDQLWCSYKYQLACKWDAPCMGCVKFDASLMERFPQVPDRISKTWMGLVFDGEKVMGSHWRRLDMAVALELQRRGINPHYHEGEVEHRHVYGVA